MILNPQRYKLICLHVLDILNVDDTDMNTCMLNIRHNVDPSNVEYWKQLYCNICIDCVITSRGCCND